MSAAGLPNGTVTFLFTDVEGSTVLLHEIGAERYGEALAEHRRVRRHVVVYGLVQMTCEECGREADEHADSRRAYLFVTPRTNSQYPHQYEMRLGW